MHRLAWLWAHGDISMSNFDLVVLIPFRDIVRSLQETIEDKYDKNTADMETLTYWMNANTKRILFLLDGYDEFVDKSMFS